MSKYHSSPIDIINKAKNEINLHQKYYFNYYYRKTPKSSTPSVKSAPMTSNPNRIKVIVRIRPLIEYEIDLNSKVIVKVNNGCVELNSPSIPGQVPILKQYVFDRCFDQNTSQEVFYKNSGIEELINFSLNGYNSTVFAYGQTGSGKTYTITGPDDDIIEGYSQPLEIEGVLQRSLRYLFQQNSMLSSIKIKASYCEIYNEMVYDLLNLDNTKLNLRYSDKIGYFVNGLSVIECDNINEIMEVVEEGRRNRTVCSHELNKESSRSHSLLTVYLDRLYNDEGSKADLTKTGKICFVDLAGSERLSYTKSDGVMLKETGSINKSLFTLGKVISALSSNQSTTHIPYRDSTLTKLLMDSIGGSAYTVMVACVSPCDKYYYYYIIIDFLMKLCLH